MTSSMIYSVGTALRRAQDNGLPVRVLVEGHWLDGRVGGVDGDGLVLVSGTDEQAVVRMASISVVRVQTAMPDVRVEDHAHPHASQTGYRAGAAYQAAPVYEAGPAAAQDLPAEPAEEYEPVVVTQRHPMPGHDAHRAVLALLAD
jgi:hypothetical protein